MRDREAYLAHGRSDPTSDDQKREHPYDFVSLPDRPALIRAPHHDRFAAGRLTGVLHLVYTTLTPLHVGSGVLETAKDCGLGDSTMPVRGIARSGGRPILPGSSWKGAVRARFEAITRSTIALADRSSREEAHELPEPLRSISGKHKVEIEDRRVTQASRAPGTIRSAEKLELSPADALFGCMGYRGRITPHEGVIAGPSATKPLAVTPLESPRMHRLAQPGEERKEHGKVVITKVEGRKFYYDGPIVHERRTDRDREGTSEPIDYVPEQSTITIDVSFVSLTQAELGALLLSAGYGNDAGVLRFGGFKPAGLGKVDLKDVSIRVGPGNEARRWKRVEPAVLDPAAAVAEAMQGLVDAGALNELDTVTRVKRPG